ncbi:PEP-CTERM sorting domain-containing protein [Okeania sp. KiyG1]|uniref:PEP-CTERM sorting domain-containing protein n=1 Tax=Okeania sp. KiyG1 TaxID=2720165 RepID=UPI001924362B|nr:PEP-CTERM sorting domain-containing protein [Okeania sp. KiyG1]GGA17986.1 hypothetical protein CYANOKiyG1_32260 [Okeania sp. KiyG1]
MPLGRGGCQIVTVTEDDMNDLFNVELTVNPWNAEALGIFIDLGDNYISDNTLLGSNVSLVGTDTSSLGCGPGCNLNGLNPPIASPDGEWEWVIRLGNQGFDSIQTFNFDIARNGLTEADWGLVGIRAQQLCPAGETLSDGDDSGCGDSDKSYGLPSTDDDRERVPEPSSILALGLIGSGMFLSRRR